MVDKLILDPSWYSRRLVIRYTLLSLLGLAVYSMYLGYQMASVVFPSVSLLAGGIIGSYVFGASWERVNGVPSLTTYTPQNDPSQTDPKT